MSIESTREVRGKLVARARHRARELISVASKKLTEALQRGQENVQSVKVDPVMLSAGNEKLNEAAKLLADIRLKKEKISNKLHQ